jgi:HEAT repeat protein
VRVNQAISAAVVPVGRKDLSCKSNLTSAVLATWITSKERTVRFTAIKLAKFRNDKQFEAEATKILADKQEDIYVRLEAAGYLVAVHKKDASGCFNDFLKNADEQNQLEAVIALGETESESAVALLCSILDGKDEPYFKKAAAAWGLGQIGGKVAVERLALAFADLNKEIKQDALEAFSSLGSSAIPVLLGGLTSEPDIAAGSAEALRRLGNDLKETHVAAIAKAMTSGTPEWATWLVGLLPNEKLRNTLINAAKSSAEVKFAVTVLSAFASSWVSEFWELMPDPEEQ